MSSSRVVRTGVPLTCLESHSLFPAKASLSLFVGGQEGNQAVKRGFVADRASKQAGQLCLLLNQASVQSISLSIRYLLSIGRVGQSMLSITSSQERRKKGIGTNWSISGLRSIIQSWFVLSFLSQSREWKIGFEVNQTVQEWMKGFGWAMNLLALTYSSGSSSSLLVPLLLLLE